MSDDALPYDQWIENALRGVIQQALVHAADYGLPGAHHFYVTFLTGADGVGISADLRARHPEEMTIVLQHQFWDLDVDDEGFAVTLKFRGQSHRLTVPFSAISSFVDPSVNFGLQLKRVVMASDEEAQGDDVGTMEPPAADNAEGTESVAEVVTLDKFRKK